MRQVGPVVGAQLTSLHPQPQLGQAAVSEVGALGVLGPARQLAVEEDRHAEPADLLGHRERLGAGGGAIGWVEPDDRADVERADRRVHALVTGHVDRLDRLLGAGGEGVQQRPRPAAEREDGAVVIGVGVAVEQGHSTREGHRQRFDRRGVAALGDVGYGEQRHGSDEQLAVADERLAVDLDGGLEDHAVEVDRHLDGAADRRRGAEGDVGGAEDLLVLEDVAGEDRLLVGADPQLGDVGAVGAVRGQQLQQRGAGRPGGVGEVAAADRQRDRRTRPSPRRRSSRRRPASPRPSPPAAR